MSKTTQRKDSKALVARLAEVNTSTLPADGGPDFNRLIFSNSPYLLQHADNPVDWFPWGEEAFAKAKSENKPIFLSIGYATCHWCHVMEHECFEDNEVAACLNEKFVSIKVDREERPDLDDQYMTVSQLMTGGGGWPLSVFMTPDKQPFFTATYLPKTAKMGMPSILDVLEKVDEAWHNNRAAIMENCAQVISSLEQHSVPAAGPLEGDEISKKAFQVLARSFDAEWGGFGGAPKFPLTHYLSFLIRFWKRSSAINALWMVEDTLKMIRRGGIFDQVGLGVHRYAVDRQWLIPHFEKMLYDQAMLAHACLDAFQATGDVHYCAIAEELFSFVLDEMTSPEGGFYSAWDADTHGIEGKYYTWDAGEFFSVFDDQEGNVAARLFGVSEQGNFEGTNILHLRSKLEDFAKQEGITLKDLQDKLETWRRKLLAHRDTREKPLRDEKILTAWNGLMISALAKGYAVTGIQRYREAAESAIRFIEGNMLSEGGRLQRSYYRGTVSIPGFLEDYAFYSWGLLELYEATMCPEYIDAAQRYVKGMIRLFQDAESYGLFDTSRETGDVLVRKKSGHDGVMPSGNAIAALMLIKLGKISDNSQLLEEGKGILRAFMGTIAENPLTGLNFLTTFDYLTSPETIITFSGALESPEASDMLRSIRRRFIPGLVLRHEEEAVKPNTRNEQNPVTVQVCAKGTCRLPVTDVRDLETLLDEIS